MNIQINLIFKKELISLSSLSHSTIISRWTVDM